MLFCKKLCNTAKEPRLVENHNGCFQLFLAYPLVVEPRQSARIDTGLAVKISTSLTYYPMVVSDVVADSKGLIVNDFNSLVYSKNNEVAKLEFTVYNTSDTTVKLDIGDPIARLIIYQTFILDVKSVEQFPTTELDLIKTEVTPHITQAKTEVVWFKRMIRDDFQDCFNRFFTTLHGEQFHKQIENMRETNEYKQAVNKSKYEADWAWNNMPEQLKEDVKKQFKEYKKKLYNLK
jgi:dUTPase